MSSTEVRGGEWGETKRRKMKIAQKPPFLLGKVLCDKSIN
jgi:hypothetical protein